MVTIALAFRAPWPARWVDTAHIAVAGLLLHGAYLSFVFVGIDRGVPAGIMALIVGAQPVVTAIVVGPLLGERVRPIQWLGFVCGFAGLAMVVGERINMPQGDSPAVLAFGFMALLAITAGTLYQKRFCPQLDLRSGTAIQYLATAVVLVSLSLLLDSKPVQWTGEFVFALFWLSLVLSLGAVTLLYILLRRGAASKVASLFYLVPPTAATYAWLLFGETMGPLAIAGMAVIMVGIILVNRPAMSSA